MAALCVLCFHALACVGLASAGTASGPVEDTQGRGQGPPPHAPCPPACLWDTHWRQCGQVTRLPNGTNVGTCPQALVFSVGFDSDMVLQRAPAKAAVYGQLFQAGSSDQVAEGTSVVVTVSETGGSSYTIQAEIAPIPTYSLPGGAANYSASWKAYLKPAAAGGDYTITAVCTGCGVSVERSTATIHRATFGDVYFCSGQSNMALPTTHSYSAVELRAQMAAGKFKKLRWFQFESMGGGRSGTAYSPMWTRQTGSTGYNAPGNDTTRVMTWFNASYLIRSQSHVLGFNSRYGAAYPISCPEKSADRNPATCANPSPEGKPFFEFSAACMEFGRNLVEMLGDDGPPVGLIQSAIGGSTIEAWSANETTAQCQNKTANSPSAGPPRGHLYYGMVTPFVNTSIAGWVWYQGENDVGGIAPGKDIGTHTPMGYSCMQPRMVAHWREIWSTVDGTTDALAPFGLVTLAPSGSEGNGNKLSAFRWAQTASYGVLPNPAMPRTFVAQAYDLNDPWAGSEKDKFDETVHTICSFNASLPYSCAWRGIDGTSEPPPCCKCGPDFASKRCVWNVSAWNRDLAPLAPLVRNSTATPQFMGSLHPRLKEPVGRRLAAGLVALNYNGSGPMTGPTIAGCKYESAQHTITVQFNKTLLKGDTVAITRSQTPIPPLPPPEGHHSPSPTRPGPVVDSSLTHVCTGDAEDCACLSWVSTPHAHPWIWTCTMPAADVGRPRAVQQSRGDIWTEVSIRLLPDKASIAVDTQGLNISTGGVHAIKFGWSESDGTCCIDLLANTGLAPCIPGSCGLMTGDSLLPANPYLIRQTGPSLSFCSFRRFPPLRSVPWRRYFATIGANGQCTCPPPQQCDGY